VTKEGALPVLYSFRRCPYAMRARMAIAYSGTQVELRDILLKDKPRDMIAHSPKATVPVLKDVNGTVLEESLDIMYWALQQADPEEWLPDAMKDDIRSLVEENDGPFKESLDRYKYHVRFPEYRREVYRKQGEVFLQKLEGRLSTSEYLMGEKMNFADIAIFPFIRQFANSDRVWFDEAPYPALHNWLQQRIDSPLFELVMKKRDIWKPDNTGPVFPEII
jgi:glutathione S-transferase